MAPSPFDTAKLTLDYLPYACEFDPQDANRLLVGGGGGANRSGVANKIVRTHPCRPGPPDRMRLTLAKRQ